MEESSEKDKIDPISLREYWKHPITVIAFLILISIIMLIGANVVGLDKGHTLERLAEVDFARGLITYLFAVGTIGVIVAVIIASLIGSIDEKVRRAKDVLSILIGIFGTIVGYYFGSDRSNIQQSASESIEISAPRGPAFFVSGQPLNISTMVTGGSPPYNYWIHFESQTITGVTNDFITETLTVTAEVDTLRISIFVKDKEGVASVKDKMIPMQKE